MVPGRIKMRTDVLPLCLKETFAFSWTLDTGIWHVMVLICWNGDDRNTDEQITGTWFLISWIVQGQGHPAWLWETHSILNGVVHIEYLNGELPSQEKLGREWVQSYSIRVWDPVFSWWFLGRGDQAAKPDQCLSFTSLGTPSLTEVWKMQRTPVTNRDSSYWLELPC